MKCIFIDTETTGTDPSRHGIVQLAGALFNDRQMLEQFNIKCQPFAGDEIEDEALAITGLSRPLIATFQPGYQACREFTAMLGKHIDKYNKKDKAHFIAYNADFDAAMVRAWFLKAKDEYFGSWFWFPVLDVAKLAGIRCMQRRVELENFKLMTVAQYFEVVTAEEAEAGSHDAGFDIKVTMRLFKKLTKDLGLFEYQTQEVSA